MTGTQAARLHERSEKERFDTFSIERTRTIFRLQSNLASEPLAFQSKEI